MLVIFLCRTDRVFDELAAFFHPVGAIPVHVLLMGYRDCLFYISIFFFFSCGEGLDFPITN